jgi:DNA (cytosine-5)-methyltransferase 1
VNKFNYEWTLKDANFTKDKGSVFSCFACGGGSTMGYKLAGFDVIGCNEIDPKMIEAYRANHNPKYSYLEPIQEFKNREDLPKELYNLDILDGSPPCSSFSMAGNREKDWGKDKKFREGQAEQVLDTLFFDFLDLGEKLQPKVIIAENVKGMLLGAAQKYVDKVLTRFDEVGYYVDFKLLDASRMGVPQRRERVFFYAIRKDLYKGGFEDLFGTRPILDLEFNEKEIPFKEIADSSDVSIRDHTEASKYWDLVEFGQAFSTQHEKGHFFGSQKAHPNKPINTIVADNKGLWHYSIKRLLNKKELLSGGSYPIDYNFLDLKPKYLIGMSVPPVMTAQIATRVHEQWLNDAAR